MPAVKGDGMRGLAVFISDIRNCKSKEAELKRINKELANIRSKFKEDPSNKARLLECLEGILNKAQDAPKSKKVQHSNAKNAVLFEAIALIIHMDSEPNLLVRACNQLGAFLTHRETNLRYLALESMCLLATSEFSHEAVKKHQETIITSLKTERDVSVRQRAVDLLYAMCDRTNAGDIVQEMLAYLETADYSIREEMVLKVAILAEKYATDYTWYVDVILKLIRIAGDYVSEEVWYRVIQIVVNREDVQGYAAKTVFEALQRPACHENMVKVGGYILGEFGNLIAGDQRSAPQVQFDLLHSKYHLCSINTRCLLLTTYVKFCNLFPEIKHVIQELSLQRAQQKPDSGLYQEQTFARLGMFYGNKTPSQFTDFKPVVVCPGALSVQLQAQAKPIDASVGAMAQVQQLINFVCVQEFNRMPILQISFNYTQTAGGAARFDKFFYLPIFINKFFEPTDMTSETFFARWKALGIPSQESQKIFTAKHPIDTAAVNAKLTGVGAKLLVDVDPNPDNFVCAGIIHTQTQQIGTLIRLEPNKQAKVQSLGCTSFALLFDDIPKEMHRADQDRYDSFAQAQVQVTNKIYEMLGRPVFMFCPTEYCETRAHPRIADSEYLDTVGRFLHSEIYVMWTGRSVAVKESISGLLLNPNNKHETNLMAIATTSQWRHAVADADGMNTEDNASLKVYCPEEALNKALADWEKLFNTETAEVPTVKPQNYQEGLENPDIPLPSESAAVSRSGSVAMDSDLTVPPDVSAEVALPVMAVDEMVHAVMGDPNLQDATEPDLVNSLVPEYNTCTVMGTPIGANSHKNSHEEGVTEDPEAAKTEAAEMTTTRAAHLQITAADLRKLLDIFYLPFQYGPQVEKLLTTLVYLLNNAHKGDRGCSPTTIDGLRQAIADMYQFVNEFNGLYWKIMNCPNKPLLSELLPYVWDAHGTLSLIEGLSHWIAAGNMRRPLKARVNTWTNTTFEDEAWCGVCPARGFSVDVTGLLANSDGLLDLLRNRNPLPMSIRTFHVRTVTVEDTINFHHLFGNGEPPAESNEELFDHHFGPYTFSPTEPHFGFISYEEWVEEDAQGLRYPHCAGTGIKNVDTYLRNIWPDYQAMMMEKYKETIPDEKDRKAKINLWKPHGVSSDITQRYPSRIHLHAKFCTDDSVAMKRIVQTLATVLSYSGSAGVHVVCEPDDYQKISFLAKLQFNLIPTKRADGLEIYGYRFCSYVHSSPSDSADEDEEMA
ncbi:unnamed protein product, partial [Mesorhabditis spiculigera]